MEQRLYTLLELLVRKVGGNLKKIISLFMELSINVQSKADPKSNISVMFRNSPVYTE